MNDEKWMPGIGGCGGVFFMVSPGEFLVEVEKRDLNLNKKETELRAILFAPDRRVIQEAIIPDDRWSAGSGMGPPQHATLSAWIDRTGLYGIIVTVSNDPGGEDVIWRFRTNCPKYMMEASFREAPIVMREPERSADIYFLPPVGKFGLEISDLPNGTGAVTVEDEKGCACATLEAANDKVSCEFEADEGRGRQPWRLHLPKARATVNIDRVTRGDTEATFAKHVHSAWWTPEVNSWFLLDPYRWLIAPYNQTLYAGPGEEKDAVFTLNNNGIREIPVDIELEFPDVVWDARITETHRLIGPKASVEIMVHCVVPGKGGTVHLRVRPTDNPSFTTYATLNVLEGSSPGCSSLDLPVVLKPFRHENEQFGYRPDYPMENQVYFDLNNRPFIRTSEGVVSWRDDQWVANGQAQPVTSPHTGPWTRIAFDKDGDVYVAARTQGDLSLLHSSDGGRNFSAYPLPAEKERSSGNSLQWKSDLEARVNEIEVFSGHNTLDGPPPTVRYTRRHKDPNVFWRMYGDLDLLLPKKTAAGLEWEEPVFLTDKSLGMASHSGIPSVVVSRGAKIHVVWGEATASESDIRSGVPVFAATYDRDTGRLSKPVCVGTGRPANDIHNTPCITIDSKGYLHVLTGAHGSQFYYARSLNPNDTAGGFTEPVRVRECLSQTYIGLVCGPDDTLHLVFREWRSGSEYFPNSTMAVLASMLKRPGESWSKPQTLVVAPFSGYSCYYHRLTIDRKGRLFLSYDYQSGFWFYRADQQGRRRALMMSPDDGRTWKLVEDTGVILEAI